MQRAHTRSGAQAQELAQQARRRAVAFIFHNPCSQDSTGSDCVRPFAAGIDVVGISDWVTFLERTSSWRRAHREREYGSLANHRELLASISPIHKAEVIQMPLMVLAGDNDPRVPLYESEQIVERVRAAGGTVHFVHYADEGHRFSKLANRIDSFTQMAAFLEQYLMGDHQ